MFTRVIFQIQGLPSPLLRVVRGIKPPFNSSFLHFSCTPSFYKDGGNLSLPSHTFSSNLSPFPKAGTTVFATNVNFQNAQTKKKLLVINLSLSACLSLVVLGDFPKPRTSLYNRSQSGWQPVSQSLELFCSFKVVMGGKEKEEKYSYYFFSNKKLSFSLDVFLGQPDRTTCCL